MAIWARRPEAVEEVNVAGCAHLASTSVAEVISDADVIVFATPIGAMPELAVKVANEVSKAVLVTDVGSVKGSVVQELDPIFHGRARFIGSHPMAGSEQTGLKFAREDLFQNAACIITPTKYTEGSAVPEVTTFWQALGCTVRELSPEAHDEAVAWVSHLPHALAATLVNAVTAHNPEALALCGPGFRDTTRVAGGHPPMWTEILAENHAAVRKSLDALIEKLRELATLFDRPASERDSLMNQFLTQAQAQRDRLRRPN